MVTGRPEWIDAAEASRLADVPISVVLRAVAEGELSGNRQHPSRRGLWSVRTVDAEAWARDRSRARAEFDAHVAPAAGLGPRGGPEREAPMYVVTAEDQRPGPPAFRQHGDRRTLPAMPVPIGIQHAVSGLVGAEGTRALCGADVGGWVVFRGRPFIASSGATCQRCAQLAASVAEG